MEWDREVEKEITSEEENKNIGVSGGLHAIGTH